MSNVQRLTPVDRLENASRQAVRSATSAPGLQMWQGDAILTNCRSSMLLAQLHRWRALALSGTPLLKDLYSSDEESTLADAMILCQRGDDFIYVYQGARSISQYGRNLRGMHVSETGGRMTPALLRVYRQSLAEREPLYVQYATGFSENHIYWERLVLPTLSSPREGGGFVLLYSAPLDDKHDILKTAFERSSMGMIAATPELGEGATLNQARLLLINQKARDLLQLSESGLELAAVGDLKRWLKDTLGWVLFSKATDGDRHRLVYDCARRRKRYSFAVEPVGRFVIFHITEEDAGA